MIASGVTSAPCSSAVVVGSLIDTPRLGIRMRGETYLGDSIAAG